jgi:hypothetical protein
LAHHSKKKEIMETLKIENSILNCTIPPLLATHIGERRTPFSKAYKSEEVWRKCWENIGNPLET